MANSWYMIYYISLVIIYYRFGSIKGVAIHLFIHGIIWAPLPLALMGLVLSQVAAIHFRRAIIIADVKEGNEDSIFSCWTKKRCGGGRWGGRCGGNNNNSNNNNGNVGSIDA